ncbi:hypothetical protein CHARACLAT_025960 [Characodon lateralis]|uniref:Uncharacterized protein n=1 Tax=Characodon lateralis TaxID=208331 RepID=A0ABU7DVY4_9TELE|nr:hypothetical protein [Characodon lateralis]
MSLSSPPSPIPITSSSSTADTQTYTHTHTHTHTYNHILPAAAAFSGKQKAALARRHSRVPVFICVKWRPYITTAVGNTKKPRPSHAGRGKERSARLRKPPLKDLSGVINHSFFTHPIFHCC